MEAATVPQHMAALAHANDVRLRRAAVKRQIARGALSIRDALDEDAVQTMRIWDLLAAQRRWGPRRVRTFLDGVNRVPRTYVAGTRMVKDLTAHQRQVIISLLG